MDGIREIEQVHTRCLLCHAGSTSKGDGELTIQQFLMPDDDDYALEQVAYYILPVDGGDDMDVALDSTILWMATDQMVSCRRHL